jgi:hypothetical protein
MDPKDLKYQYVRNTALPYKTNESPIAEGIGWESGSVNFLTSMNQYLEKAPGFASYEASASTFTGTLKRIFTWERWDGSFYILACEVYAGHSKVHKLKVGTDAAFVQIYDDDSVSSPTVGYPFDFVPSNDKLYFANGQTAQVYEGTGTTVRDWGISTAPMVGTVGPPDYTGGQPVATVSATVGTMSATVGYRYVYSYGNSSSGHISSASNPSVSTGVFSAKASVTITGIASTDSQVDGIHVFRTTDGGGGIYFELPNSPFSNPAPGGATVYGTAAAAAATIFTVSAGHGLSSTNVVTIMGCATSDPNIVITGTWSVTVTSPTTFTIPVDTSGTTISWGPFGISITLSSSSTIVDTATDAELSSYMAPVGADLSTSTPPTPLGQNDPPIFDVAPPYGSSWKGVTWFANRIWGFFKNSLYYTVWEEGGDYGLAEECIPKSNYMVFSQPITAIATNEEFLLVFTANTIWKISGESLETFTRSCLFSNLGVRDRSCVARLGKSIAWFDISHTVRVTDGFQQSELSVDIRPDLESVDPDLASLSFFCNGKKNWLCLLDGATQMFVYDLDMSQWLPPWTHVGAATAIHWGETATGTPLLLIGSAGKKVLKMTPSTYAFDGSSYTALARTSLFDIVEKDKIASTANAQIITIERNSVQLSEVKECRDDDPTTVSWDSDFGNIATQDSISPPLRPIASEVVEEWFSTQQIGCRRMALQFEWAAASTQFKLFSFGIGSYPL